MGGQVVGHALRTALGQVHIQLAATGAVGVANDLDGVLVELLERVGQVVQRLVEAAGDRVRVGGEGNVARHDQLDLVTLALHLDPGVRHAFTQFFLLLVGVVAIARRTGTRNDCANQRALATVVMVDGRTGQCTSQRTEAAVLGGFAHAAFGTIAGLSLAAVIRVR